MKLDSKDEEHLHFFIFGQRSVHAETSNDFKSFFFFYQHAVTEAGKRVPRKTGEYSEMLSDRTRCKPSLDFYSTLTAWSNISQREINKKSSRFIIPSPPVLSDLLVGGSFRQTTRLTFRRAFPVQVSEELGEPSNRTRGLERWPDLDQRPHKKYAYILPQSTLLHWTNPPRG